MTTPKSAVPTLTLLSLLCLTTAMVGCSSAEKLFQEEVDRALSQTEAADTFARIRLADLQALPVPVRKYLLRSGVVGKERVRTFHARMRGRIKTSEGGRWLSFRAEHYSTLGRSYTRLFFIRARMYGFIPVVGRDKYAGGKGEMLIRPLDLFAAAHVTGPDMDRAAPHGDGRRLRRGSRSATGTYRCRTLSYGEVGRPRSPTAALRD